MILVEQCRTKQTYRLDQIIPIMDKSIASMKVDSIGTSKQRIVNLKIESVADAPNLFFKLSLVTTVD